MTARSRYRLLITSVLSGALAAASLVPLAATAQADAGPVPLGLTSFARIVVDEPRGHLFVSPGRSGSGVLVTDLQGGHVATVGSLPGATGLALTPDGASLWVALPTVGALSRVDTSSLQVVQTIALPTGQCPGDVAVVGTRLVYGHSCNQYAGTGGYGGLGVVDARTGASYGSVTSGPFYKPVVASGRAGQVFAADAAVSPTGLHLYDVSGTAPVLVATRAQACSNLRDLAARPDGGQVVTACGSPYRHDIWSADKLDPVGSYPSADYPSAGAWSADGSTFVAGTDSAYSTDVRIYTAGATTPRRAVDFASSGELLLPRGLAVSADGRRTWAVSGSSGGGVALRVLDDATRASTLSVAADPPYLYEGESTAVGGRLTNGGVGVAGVQLSVSRTSPGASPAPLAPVTTRADGTFVLTDTPPGLGSHTYTVAWSGDSARDGTSGSTTVTVQQRETSLRLTLAHGASAGAVAGLVQLRYTGGDPAGRTVSLVRTGGGLSVALPPVTTDVNGGAKFNDSAPAGAHTYTATVEAYGPYPAGSASATITVPASTSLTAVATPGSAWAGEAVTVSGTLTSGSSPVGGATVEVTRSGCSTTGWSGKASTSADGAWAVTDSSPQVGTCSYAVTYAGGSDYSAARTATSATVSLRPTELTLTAVRGTGSNKKFVDLTAHLGGWRSNRTLTITAQPSGGQEVVLASGPVDAAGDLKARHQPKTTTTYRVRYSGDEWYSAAMAERTL